MAGEDIFQPQPQLDTVRVRTERVMKLVSRRLLTMEEATGGLILGDAFIDPDRPSGDALRALLQSMGRDYAKRWIAESGMLENEVIAVHTLRVYIDGELAYEQDMA